METNKVEVMELASLRPGPSALQLWVLSSQGWICGVCAMCLQTPKAPRYLGVEPKLERTTQTVRVKHHTAQTNRSSQSLVHQEHAQDGMVSREPDRKLANFYVDLKEERQGFRQEFEGSGRCFEH
eukprot:1159462-Pelagomonas_calceolata.AAC.5